MTKIYDIGLIVLLVLVAIIAGFNIKNNKGAVFSWIYYIIVGVGFYVGWRTKWK